MYICTFFGHSDAPKDIFDKLYLTLDDLIANKNVGYFLVGNQGEFDKMAVRALRLLKTDHPHIDYEVVLPYLSAEFGDFYREDETVFPEILDECPPKYCIDRRNRWMVKESDYVVCYVKYDFTRSAKYVDLAKSKGKTVINLATDKI